MRILFLAVSPPNNLLRGYQVRAYHQLRLLSVRHRVTLVCFAPRSAAREEHRIVSGFCEDVLVVPLRTTQTIAGLARGIFSGRPLQAAWYETAEMRRTIGRLLGERRHDLVHVQLARMAGLLDEATSIPRVIDFVDALSLNLRRRAEYDRGVLSLAARLEAQRLLRLERDICQSWNHAMVVSPVDREAIGSFPNLTVNPSGVDLQEFRYSSEGRDRYSVIFTGNLGYFSNVDAICWFAREVFPIIRRSEPKAKLVIVGARPSRKVRALCERDPQIKIEGTVSRLPPHLERSGVSIAPMRAGSGQLFKVLEAMACGSPLVATRVAMAGMEAESGRHFLLADTREAFAQEVLRLMRGPGLASHIATEARRLVERNYSWEHSVSALEETYRSVLERGRRSPSQQVAAH